MIFEKVDELCELIEETKQYSDFLEAEVNLENDGEGIDILSKFLELQEQYVQAYSAESFDEADTLELQLQEGYKKVMEHPTAGAYVKSKQAFDDLLDEVNNRIMENLGLLQADMQDGCASCSDHESCEGCH